MNKRATVLVGLGLLLLLTAFTQSITPQAALECFFTRETIEQGWFSDVFLAAVPLTQLEALSAHEHQRDAVSLSQL